MSAVSDRALAYFLSSPGHSAGGPLPVLTESDRPHRCETFPNLVPARAAVLRQEHASVLGADDNGRAEGYETARIHVVAEPFRRTHVTAFEGRPSIQRTAVDGCASTVVAGGRAEQHGVVREGDRATVVRVQPVILPLPGVATVAADTESLGRRDQHEAGTIRRSQYLVNILLDVERRAPAVTAIRRSEDTAHMHVDVETSAAAIADRAHVGRCAPRRVPLAPALGLIERRNRNHASALETKEMGMRGSNQQSARRRGKTGRPSLRHGRHARPAEHVHATP